MKVEVEIKDEAIQRAIEGIANAGSMSFSSNPLFGTTKFRTLVEIQFAELMDSPGFQAKIKAACENYLMASVESKAPGWANHQIKETLKAMATRMFTPQEDAAVQEDLAAPTIVISV